MNKPTYEEVNGTIIGGDVWRYEFWIEEPRGEYQHKRGIPKRRIDSGYFENDEQAHAWVAKHYPAEYKQGIEMRCFDRG